MGFLGVSPAKDPRGSCTFFLTSRSSCSSSSSPPCKLILIFLTLFHPQLHILFPDEAMSFLKKTTTVLPSAFSLRRLFTSLPSKTQRTYPPAILTSQNPAFPTGFPSLLRKPYHTNAHGNPQPRFIVLKRRGPRKLGSLRPATVVVITIVGTVGVITVYSSNLETIPYTKRTHLVLLSPNVERELGETQFKQLKAAMRGKILPCLHPESIRVRDISEGIIESLKRGLRKGIWEHHMEYSAEEPLDEDHARGRIWAFGEMGRKRVEHVKWSGKDDALDDEWVERSRKERKDRSEHDPATRHLEGLNWEVVVVRDPLVNAVCMPGGKIIVFTGLLEHFKTDSEIATIIGHEVGHVAEGITKSLWLMLLQLILLQFVFMPDLINALSNIFLRFPFSRRQ